MKTIQLLKQNDREEASFAPDIKRRLGPGDDLEMINNPDLWPLWPVLPLKNPREVDPVDGTKPNLGFIVHGQPTVVVIGVMLLTNLTTARRRGYSSVEALLEDGWEVD